MGYKQARVFVPVKPFQPSVVLTSKVGALLARDKHSNTFGPFISLKEKSFVKTAPGSISVNKIFDYIGKTKSLSSALILTNTLASNNGN